MNIFKIFKSFLLGFFIGVVITWLYKYTGFAKLLSDLEIIWASLIGSIAWWFKVLYEKWSSEKISISSIEKRLIENHNTLDIYKIILEHLYQNIKKYIDFGTVEIYNNTIVPLKIPSQDELGSLRNLDLINNIFKINIILERNMIVMNKLWESYQTTIILIFKNRGAHSEDKQSLLDFQEAIKEFEKQLSTTQNSILVSLAHIHVSAKKLKESFFGRLNSLAGYHYSEEDITEEIKILEKEKQDKYERTQ